MVCPHPETIEIAWVLRDRLKASDPEGRDGLKTWNATRPPFVEADAVQRAAYVAHTAGAPLYVVHTSSAEALEAALRHRRAGPRCISRPARTISRMTSAGPGPTSGKSTRRD